MERQINYAEALDKLVTIHCVYEWEKLYKSLDKLNLKNLKQKGKIVLHSFQGTKSQMEKMRSLNVWFSLSPGCYNEKNYEMIKALPLDRLILESDSPSMFNKDIYSEAAEFGFYFKEESGKLKNHPLCIIQLAQRVSELRGLAYEELLQILHKNGSKIINALI